MAHSTDHTFVYLLKIFDDTNEKYYLKSTINEHSHTISIHLTNFKHSWVGKLNQEQVRVLAEKFPLENNDSFYSHTQRAFSKGHKAEIDGRTYVFNCKKLDKNRLEFVWKEKIEALNSLKVVGSIKLEEQPNDEILSEIMDYTIEEMEALRSTSEQKTAQIERITGQLHRALETVKQTVDIKEQLEADLYRKFVLVLNAKKNELAKLKHQLESYQNEHPTGANDNDFHMDSHSRSTSPIHTVTTTLDDIEPTSNKRRRRDTDTSDDEVVEQPQILTQTKIKVINNDSSLDLGNDQIDYKPTSTTTTTTTMHKHHQHRRKYVTGANSISTRPFVNHAATSSTMATPSLPDDSETADDLLNKI